MFLGPLSYWNFRETAQVSEILALIQHSKHFESQSNGVLNGDWPKSYVDYLLPGSRDRNLVSLPALCSYFISWTLFSLQQSNMLTYINGDKEYQPHDVTVDVGAEHFYSQTGQLRFRIWTNKQETIRYVLMFSITHNNKLKQVKITRHAWVLAGVFSRLAIRGGLKIIIGTILFSEVSYLRWQLHDERLQSWSVLKVSLKQWIN